MSETKESAISAALLTKLIEEQYKNGNDNKHNTELITECLGGIHSLLPIILRIQTHQNETIINQNQLEHIHQIITTPHDFQHHYKYTTQTLIQKDKIQEMDDNNTITLTLNPNNNYLLRFFRNKTAATIWNLIHSKICGIVVLLLVSFLLIIWLAAIVSDWNNTLVLIAIIYITFLYLISISTCIFWILSSNKIAFKKIIRNIDFWLIIFYVTKEHVCNVCMDVVSPPDKAMQYIMQWYFWLYIMFIMIRMIGSSLWIIVFLLFDGIKMRIFLKRGMAVLFVLLYVSLVIYYWFESYSTTDDSLIHIYGDVAISLKDQRNSAWEMVFIFIFKQFFNMMFRRERASQIIYRPNIVWKNYQSKNEIYLSKSMLKQQNNINKIKVEIVEDKCVELCDTNGSEFIPTNKNIREKKERDLSLSDHIKC
eukprot:122161_1